MSKINYEFGVAFQKGIAGLKKFTSAFKLFGTSVNNSSKSMGKLYPTIKKNNMAFTNFTKDANRATKSLGSLTKGFGGLKQVIGLFSFYRISQSLTSMISSAMDMIETANLFSVAMGAVAVETNKSLTEMSKLTGLDLTNIQTAVGTYASLARSMGITNKEAQNLSTTSYRLALDLASLYNVDINQALGDLRSGLVGQSETVYKYGIDVTEASLKTEALAQGITKSVRNMSQGEKMALRYAVMIRQTTLAQGDFSRTLDQPANQLRVLKERFITLGRSIGNLFIPVLARILPYLNAIVVVLLRIVASIATLVGAELPEITNMGSALDGMGSELSDDLDDANGSAKKLKSTLAGFDEINILGSQDTGSAGGTGAMAGGVDTSWLEGLSYDSQFDKIKQKTDELANLLEKPLRRILEIVTLIGIVFLSWKIANSLINFLTNPLVGKGLLDTFRNIKTMFLGGQGVNALFLGWTAVITIIIARFVDLYKNSETFRTGLERLGEIISGVFELAGIIISPIVNLLKDVALKLVELIPENVRQDLQTFFKEFGLDWKDLGITALGVALMFIPGGQVFGAVLLGFQAITTIIRGLGSVSKETWDNLKQSFADMLVDLKTNWENVWRAIGNFFINIINGITQNVANRINAIISVINTFVKGVNSMFDKIGVDITIKTIGNIAIDKLSALYAPPATKPMLRYANGGIPSYGQMFIAREAGAELVGGFGSQTGVMNNDQIVESVSRGVYEAVASAMGGGAGGSIVVKIGEDTIVEKVVSSINRHNRITGKTIINV